MHKAAYLWVRQPSQVRVEVEVDSPGGSRQSDPSDQQDDEHSIREGCCEVNNLDGKTFWHTSLRQFLNSVFARMSVESLIGSFA